MIEDTPPARETCEAADLLDKARDATGDARSAAERALRSNEEAAADDAAPVLVPVEDLASKESLDSSDALVLAPAIENEDADILDEDPALPPAPTMDRDDRTWAPPPDGANCGSNQPSSRPSGSNQPDRA
jgi:hypothetical protein